MITSFSMNHSDDLWLNETFGSNEPEHVLSVVEKIFSKPEAKEKNFWSTHEISFQKGELSVIEGFTETSDKIQMVANFILMSQLSIKNKREVFQHINRFFKEKNILFEDQESSVAFKEQIEGSKEKNFNIPASLYMLSDFLSILVENEKDPMVQRNDFPFLFLPKNISHDNFQYFLDVFRKNQKPPLSILSAMQLLQIGEILDIDDYSIQHLLSAIDYDSISIEELKKAIDQWEILSKATAQQIISNAIMGYISFAAQKKLSIEQMFSKFLPGGETMLTKPMLTPPLSLTFRYDVNLQEGDLERLAMLFSSVELLNLKNTQLKTLPLVWTESLRFLTISNGIKEIPKGFLNLETFDASSTRLSDVSGLDELSHLRIVKLGNSKVRRAPTGCFKLEEFYADFKLSASLESLLFRGDRGVLDDIKGLDGLPNLRIVSIGDSQVKRAPAGCLKLEEFYANFNQSFFKASSSLFSIKELDELPNLRILKISGLKVSSAPTGCLKLEEFEAHNCNKLHNISGLDKLQYLRIVSLSSTLVQKVPNGCPKLEKFEASHCKLLKDISGLYRSPSLRFLSISNAGITQAPRGCLNLETFEAKGCPINNIDGLEETVKLTSFHVDIPDEDNEVNKIFKEKCNRLSESLTLRNKNKART